MRALESIQNQDLYDLQIVVVCRDAAPGVRHSLQVAADRDIHIDLIDVEDAKRGACLRAGFDASRGSQIIAMNADEWFAPQALSKMVDIACDTAADIVFPTVSLDRYDAHRERHSRVLDAASIVIEDKSSMVAGLPQLILGGLVAQVSGVMYSRPLFEACLLCDKTFRTVGFMACALSQAQRVSGCGDACFHAAAPKLTDAFDPTMYAKVSDDTRALDELADMGVDYRILFVEASESAIVRRYKESRRPHPLQAESRCSLPEAVRRESELLAPVRERADYVINTTGLTLSMLQKRICEIFVDGGTRRDILINVVAFGFKYGIPIDADLVFDVRFLPNPFYVEKLRPLSGMDDEVQEYVLRSDVAQRFLEKLTGMIDFLLPQYAAEGRYALTIGIGCTGGQHRSVAVAKVLTDYLAARDANVRLRNRDFPKT